MNIYTLPAFMKRISLVTMVLISSLQLFGQGEANNWYFGVNLGLNFSTDPPTVLTGGIDFTTNYQNIGGFNVESSTSVSNAAGELLFATNGRYIFDGNMDDFPGVQLSTTSDAAQGNIVMPVPGTTDQYYVGTVDACNGCDFQDAGSGRGANYRIFTVSGAGAGNLSVGNEVQVNTNSTEAQLAVPKTDGSDEFWWVLHETGSSRFNVYSVTGAAVNPISLDDSYNVGPTFGSDEYFAVLKSNSCYTKVAMAAGGQVTLLDFDGETGVLSNPLSWSVPGAYGIEFSPNGNYLYVFQNEVSAPELFQYDISSSYPSNTGTGAATISATEDPIGTEFGGAHPKTGHLQLGPDGRIYAGQIVGNGVSGSNYPHAIGAILNPDDDNAVYDNDFITFNDQAAAQVADLRATTMGMPTFLKSFVSSIASLTIDGLDASTTTICSGETVDLEVAIDGQGVSGINWTVSGANTGTQSSGATFNIGLVNPGVTNIEVQVTDNCQRDKIIDVDVDVLPIETVDGDVNCTGNTATVTGTGSSTGNYAWYVGDPDAGGTLVGIGATIDVASGTDLWVEPTGAQLGSWSSQTATLQQNTGSSGDFTLLRAGLSFTDFRFTAFTNGVSFNGDGWSAQLLDDSNNPVGSAVTGTFGTCANASPSACAVDVSPTDWVNLPQGDYSVELTFPGASTTIFRGVGINGVQTEDGVFELPSNSQINGLNFVEYEEFPCKDATQVPVACCTQLAPAASIQTGTATICTGETLTLLATPNAGTSTSNPITYQWYADGNAISGATSSTYTVPTTDAATAVDYTVTVTSSSSCSGESPESNAITVTINGTPDLSIDNAPAAVCSPNTVDITGAWDDANTTGGTVSYHSNTPAAPSNAITNQSAIASTGTYYVYVDNNGCNDEVGVSVTVNTTPSLSIDNAPAAVCSPSTVDITGAWDDANNTGGTVTYHSASPANGSNEISGANALTSSNTYYVLVNNANCTDEVSVDVVVNPLPVAALSIDETEICSTGENATVTVNVTAGATPFDITYNGSGATGNVAETDQTTPFTFDVTTEETFTLVSVEDDNGCVSTAPSTNLTGSATVSFHENVAATVTTSCDDATTETDDFVISVEVTSGDLATTTVSGNGVTFNRVGTSAVWEATGIDEELEINVSVQDVNLCNTVTEPLVNRVCSCPEEATISGTASICEEGTPNSTNLTVTFDGHTNAGQLYSFDIVETVSGTTTESVSGHNGDTDYTLSNLSGTGTYIVSNVQGACAGSGLGSAVIDYFPSPAAAISGTNEICDNATAETQITIDITSGAANFDIAYEGSVSGAQTENGYGTAQFQFMTSAEETWTVTGITDNNGCTAKASDLTGEAVITHYEDPVPATPVLTCDPANDAATNTFNFVITLDVAPGDGNVEVTADNNVIFNNTSGNTWTSGPIREGTPIDIQVTDNNGCNPIDILDQTLVCSCPTNANLSASTATTICNDGVSDVTLDVTTSNGTGPYNFTITGSGGTVFTESNYTGTFPYQVDVNTAETFQLTQFFDVTEDCDATLSGAETITVNPLPTATMGGGSPICEGEPAADITVDFTGTAPYSFTYTLDAGTVGPASIATDQMTIPGPTSGGTYLPSALTDGNGCVATAAELLGSVTIESSSKPTASISGSGTICEGDASPSVSIEVVGAGSYDISYTDGITIFTEEGVSSPFSVPVATEDGNYTYTLLSVNDGCEADASALTGAAVVQINELPAVSLALTGDPVICSADGDVTTLRATFTGTGLLTYDYQEGSVSNAARSTTAGTVDFTTTENGSHQILTVTDAEGCSGSASEIVLVTVQDPLAPVIDQSDINFCEYTLTYTLTASGTDGNAPIWFQGTEQVSIGEELALEDQAQSGAYTVQVNDGVCDASTTTSAPVQINIDPEIGFVEAGTDRSVFVGEQVSLEGQTDADIETFTWSGAVFLSTTDQLTTTAAPENELFEGEYWISLTVQRGTCFASDSALLTVRTPVTVPNTFTPNDDGINDDWNIRGISTYADAVVKIYNRWGGLVFEEYGGYSQNWNGTRNGQVLPTGTYYYVIDLGISDEDQGIQEPLLTGDVTIVD